MAVLLIAGAAVYIVTQNSDSSDVFDDEEYEETEEIDDIEDIKQIDGYVNLGLPSGTLWAEYNEPDYYDCYEAQNKFEYHLPTVDQCRELIAECEWSWNGSGYWITGPNGNSIFMPAEGISVDYEHFDGPVGVYWTSTPDGYGYTYYLGLDEDGAEVGNDFNESFETFSASYVGLSVRLVR